MDSLVFTYSGASNPFAGPEPIPRVSAPGLLGPRPADHQDYLAAPPQPAGTGYVALPAQSMTGAYAPPVPVQSYGGFSTPQVPPPWDPVLLAAPHSAPPPNNYGSGGDWYMDSGTTAHMTSHPGRPYPDGSSPM